MKMQQPRITEAFQHKKRGNNEPKNDKKVKKEKEDADNPEVVRAREQKEEELDFLRKFDLNHEYGPCNGITRLERWERAKRHGLNPPQKLADLVNGHLDDKAYTECVWFTYHL